MLSVIKPADPAVTTLATAPHVNAEPPLACYVVGREHAHPEKQSQDTL